MKDGQATCSKCGIQSEEVTSTIVIGLPGNRLDICPHCASRGHAKSINTLEEADHFIAETQQTLANLESFVTEHP